MDRLSGFPMMSSNIDSFSCTISQKRTAFTDTASHCILQISIIVAPDDVSILILQCISLIHFPGRWSMHFKTELCMQDMSYFCVLRYFCIRFTVKLNSRSFFLPWTQVAFFLNQYARLMTFPNASTQASTTSTTILREIPSAPPPAPSPIPIPIP